MKPLAFIAFLLLISITQPTSQATTVDRKIDPDVLQHANKGDFVQAQWRAGLNCEMTEFEVVKSKGHKKWVDYAKQEIKNMNAATHIKFQSPRLEIGFGAIDGHGVVLYESPRLRATHSVNVGRLGNEDYSILYCDEYSNDQITWRISAIVNGQPLPTEKQVDQLFVEKLPKVSTSLSF
ncbi:MAG: hypothetical protein MJK04_14485, partial [Psychrosphaera sp.]|nr:hypothetical protein [Psychrosphaera sp.]